MKTTELPRRLHALFDQATGWLLLGMVVFSPWAFGTTQPWSISAMNAGGFGLGLLLLLKWMVRWSLGYRPARWGRAEAEQADWISRVLGAVTALVLAYCLVSAVNARATLSADHLQFNYRACVSWLPHSYDAALSWAAFWRYLALAGVFWSARDWLLTQTSADRAMLKDGAARSALEDGCYVPRRLELLLWVVCLNGALLAGEGLLQRALGGSKLLWLVEPHMNTTAESQFGPYAYRSNAAQLLLLTWPLAVGFWWLLRLRAQHIFTKLKAYNNLLACILVMALVPLMSLSRAGTLLGVLTILAALGLLLTNSGRHRKPLWGLAWLLGAALLIGVSLEWQQLGDRFRQESLDSHRFQTWRTTWEIVKDFPVFGTGPGTFSTVYGLYRGSVYEEWDAYAHNDWLETLMTFGAIGTTLVLFAAGLVIARPFVGKGIYLHRRFGAFIYVGMGACLLYAAADFPFQVYSVLFLFLVECAVLSCLSRVR